MVLTEKRLKNLLNIKNNLYYMRAEEYGHKTLRSVFMKLACKVLFSFNYWSIGVSLDLIT